MWLLSNSLPQITIGRKCWPKREAGRRVSQSVPNICPRERQREARNIAVAFFNSSRFVAPTTEAFFINPFPPKAGAWEQRAGGTWPLTISFCKNVAFWERESPGMLILARDTLEHANSDKGDSQKASVS